MEISLKFHGILRDRIRQAGHESSTLALPDEATINELLDWLTSAGLSRRLSIAVNGTLVDESDIRLNDGDKVDVFRQAAGG